MQSKSKSLTKLYWQYLLFSLPKDKKQQKHVKEEEVILQELCMPQDFPFFVRLFVFLCFLRLIFKLQNIWKPRHEVFLYGVCARRPAPEVASEGKKVFIGSLTILSFRSRM